MAGQPEKLIENQILAYLKANNIFAWKNQTTGIFDPKRKCFRKFLGLKGVSDILGVLPGGKLLAIEVKQPKKYPTPEQREFMKRVNELGGLAFLARSVEDVERNLEGDYENKHD